MTRPVYIDAVRYQFVNLVLFDLKASQQTPESQVETKLVFNLPVPEGYPVPVENWNEDHLDEVIDYWIDFSALPLLSQCCDHWDQMGHEQAIQLMSEDAARYLFIRSELSPEVQAVVPVQGAYCQAVATFTCSSPTPMPAESEVSEILGEMLLSAMKVTRAEAGDQSRSDPLGAVNACGDSKTHLEVGS